MNTNAGAMPLNHPVSVKPRPLASRYAMLACAVFVLFLAELCIGAVAIPLRAVVEVLFTGTSSVEAWRNIIIEFRLPRAVNAAISGAALGGAGLMLQTLFRNPLADPYVLGIAHGARLGAAALVVVTGVAGNAYLARFGILGDVGLALASILGCVAILSLLAFLANRVSTVTLLVTGLMLGYLAVGLISVLLHFVDENQVRAFKAWDDASFAGATVRQLILLVPGVIAGLACAFLMVKPLNALTLGENYAISMGVPVQRFKRLALLVVAGLCGLVTAFCGPVAFLGLVGAQVARGLLHVSDHRLLLPGAILAGTVIALGADLITHLPWSRHVFHLNAVIGLVGAPIALYALLRSRAMRGLE